MSSVTSMGMPCAMRSPLASSRYSRARAAGAGVYDTPMSESALQMIRDGAVPDQMTALAALREVVEAANPDARVQVAGDSGAEKLTVHRGDTEEAEILLSNLWTQLEGMSGEEAASAIERFGGALGNAHQTVENPARFMPTLQPTSFAQVMRERGGEPVSRPLTDDEDLLLCIVADAEDHVRYLVRGELSRDIEDLEKEALDNLRRYSQDSDSLRLETRTLEVETMGRDSGDSEVAIYRLNLDGQYESSLVLLQSLVERVGAEASEQAGNTRNDFSAALAVPARDQLLLCNGRDSVAVAALSAIATSIHERAAYAISPHIYQYESMVGEPVVLEKVMLD